MTTADTLEQAMRHFGKRAGKRISEIGKVKIEDINKIIHFVIPTKECIDLMYPTIMLDVSDLDTRRDLFKKHYENICNEYGDISELYVFDVNNVHVINCDSGKFGLLKKVT